MLKKLLDREVDRWARKTYGELRDQLRADLHYVTTTEDGGYQTEVNLLESNDEYCHVSVSVDDMTFWRSVKPLTTSFISYRDGRVEKDEE